MSNTSLIHVSTSNSHLEHALARDPYVREKRVLRSPQSIATASAGIGLSLVLGSLAPVALAALGIGGFLLARRKVRFLRESLDWRIEVDEASKGANNLVQLCLSLRSEEAQEFRRLCGVVRSIKSHGTPLVAFELDDLLSLYYNIALDYKKLHAHLKASPKPSALLSHACDLESRISDDLEPRKRHFLKSRVAFLHSRASFLQKAQDLLLLRSSQLRTLSVGIDLLHDQVTLDSLSGDEVSDIISDVLGNFAENDHILSEINSNLLESDSS